jgi:hypothetical protein
MQLIVVDIRTLTFRFYLHNLHWVLTIWPVKFSTLIIPKDVWRTYTAAKQKVSSTKRQYTKRLVTNHPLYKTPLATKSLL